MVSSYGSGITSADLERQLGHELLRPRVFVRSICGHTITACRSTSVDREADRQLLHRDVQRIAPRRVLERALVRIAGGSEGEDRSLATGLQREPSSPGSPRADAAGIRSAGKELGTIDGSSNRRKPALKAVRGKPADQRRPSSRNGWSEETRQVNGLRLSSRRFRTPRGRTPTSI